MNAPWAIAIVAAWIGVAAAQAPKAAPEPAKERDSPPPAAAAGEKAQASPAAPAVAYKPPARGAPKRRVGGASRGTGDKAPHVGVLAPDHVGLTQEAQPDLYWFISRPSPVRIELTLIDGKAVAPVKEVVLSGAGREGIHRFSLREHGVRLETGTDYEWSVAVVPDPNGRSADILAGGAIRRVAPEAALASRLRGLAGTRRAAVLAEAGLWYDALATLGEEIASSSGERAARAARADLLEQVGLAEIAAWERR